MHIKKLEICGFKSFVDKTVIQFDHDVIGIVGPNGCGKSNIVDAIRWCMGEQSAKHLRGRAMEDVIFNGSESRAQHGMAEVTLTFDNHDAHYAASLPEAYREYPEIGVTRRLFRDGTSEYLINKTVVRLRDVTDLFLGTGVGTKAYSIVEQGRVGQIVTSRPQDRRTYIEEAAGVTKYRLRRKQAERKLDLTKQNLLRITDIVSEIDRSRASLKRQAAKAERYVGYRSELEDLFLHDASHRLLEMLVVEKVRTDSKASVQERVGGLRRQLEEGEAHLLAARDEGASVEQRFEASSAERARAEQRMTELKSESRRLRDRLAHFEERYSAQRNEEESLGHRLTRIGEEREKVEQRIAVLSRDEDSRDGDTAKENQELETLELRERELLRALDEEREALSTTRSERAALVSRVEALEQRTRDTDVQAERSEQDGAQFAAELTSARSAHEAAEAEVTNARSRHQEHAEAATKLAVQVGELEAELATEREALEGLNSEVNLKRSRHKVLDDLHTRLEGVGAGTKALLTSSDPAVVGLLADRLDVAARYSDALAGVLGDRLHLVIVEDPERGLELLEDLRRGKQGRATIALRRPSPLPDAPCPAADDASVLTRLIDELSYAPEDEALVRSLVGDTLVVETAQQALTLNQQFPGTRIVALEGTVVRGNGLVSGGSGEDVAAALLEQKREMKALTEELAALSVRRAGLIETCAALQDRVTALREQADAKRQASFEAEIARSTAEKEKYRLEEERARLEQRLARFEEDRAKLEQQSTELSAARREAEDKTKELAEREQSALVALTETEEQAQAARRAATEQSSRVTERRIRLAQVREQLEASRLSAERLNTEAKEAEARRTQLDSEATETAESLGSIAAQLWQTRDETLQAEQRAATLEHDVEDTRALLEQVRDSLSQREGELRGLRTSVSELDEELREHEMELQRLELGREHLLTSVGERFRGLDLNRVVGDYHMRPPPDLEHRRRIDELTKLIDRMGPVNLDAREEYEEAERRFVELNDQREDIEKAVTELERAIRHMDRESKRRFKETFEAVNELFKGSFSKLFKGGRAELKLTDPENLLETGVDIVAQPPGKRLGNIELMSGGEKALTAAALIFAIFQYRPSPFCVLDEVDAPLDDANVGRYNEAIRTMTASSQFIVITHIKQTMQAVDVLYGVTMGEPGVSRIVSVKVNEEAQTRSARNSVLEETPASSEQVVA